MSVLIACIGNIFQGDDAFGCEVARVLARRALPSNVRLVDFGIRGLDLTYALLDAPDLTILVDAVSRGHGPGTLYTIEPDLENLGEDGETTLDAHGMDPVHVLRAAKAMGGNFGRVLLVGCEPADLGGAEGRMGLTPAVAAALERAADLIESLLAEQLQETLR